MIFTAIATYLCGSSFYKMSRRHHKSGIFYGLIGAVFFLLFFFVANEVQYLLIGKNMLTFLTPFTNIASIVIGAFLCYFLLIIFDNYLREEQNNNILDDNISD